MSIPLDVETYFLYLGSHARWWTSTAPGVTYLPLNNGRA